MSDWCPDPDRPWTPAERGVVERRIRRARREYAVTMRKLAFYEAGIDATHAARGPFMDAYDGPLAADAIRRGAVKAWLGLEGDEATEVIDAHEGKCNPDSLRATYDEVTFWALATRASNS